MYTHRCAYAGMHMHTGVVGEVHGYHLSWSLWNSWGQDYWWRDNKSLETGKNILILLLASNCLRKFMTTWIIWPSLQKIRENWWALSLRSNLGPLTSRKPFHTMGHCLMILFNSSVSGSDDGSNSSTIITITSKKLPSPSQPPQPVLTHSRQRKMGRGRISGDSEVINWWIDSLVL